MADAIWPVRVSDRLLIKGYQERPPNNAIRSSISDGPPQARRISKAGVREISGHQFMTKDEVEVFDHFFTSTLVDGVLPFEWLYPRTGEIVEARFKSPPTYTPKRAGWNVAMQLEILA